MTVALVTHNVVEGDGQGRVNCELVRYLLRQGIEVELVADRVADDLLKQGATWHPVCPGFEQVDLLKVWRFKRMADRFLAKAADHYDAIIACGVTCSHPHAINAVHFVHGTWLRSPFHSSKITRGPTSWYHWLFSTLNARWERQVLRRADTVVAVSEMVRGELLEIGVSPTKLEVIVNGVDLWEYAPGEADRESLGLPEGVPICLFVGDIRSPIKNLDTVLRALKAVPFLHLAVAGDLTRSPYPAMAEQLGVDDRVHFLGFRRDVAQLMRAADFFVLASRRDSCPLVLLEALASGLPAITSSNVGTADLVENKCGFVVDKPEDEASLARYMRTLAGNTERRAAMSVAARAVAEQHTWEKMAARYLQLLVEETTRLS